MTEPVTPPPVPTQPAPAPETPPSRPYQAPTRASRLGYVFFAGVFLFVMGLFWRLVEGETGWVTSGWIFIAIVGMLVPFAWHLPDILRSAGSRRGGAFAMVVVTIALGLFVALFTGWADVKFKSRLPAIDLTKSSRYTLSEESEKLLAKVEGTVYATYLIHGEDESGLRAETLEQLRVFETSSSRVRVAEADEVRKPDVHARILREQGVQATTSGEETDVLVLTYAEPGKEVAPGKQKEIKIEPWAFRKMSSTGAPKWLGESVIASGIYELVFQKYKAYATGGHGERSFSQEFSNLRGALTTQNIEVVSEPIVLGASPKVPDDCEVLFVLGPTAPFTPEEADAVSRWLDRGKTLVLTVDVQDDRVATGLEALTEKFGIATRTNYEVVAPKLARMNVNQRDILVPGEMSNQFPVFGLAYADHPAAKALRARSGLATYFFKSTYLEIDDKPPEGAKPETVCVAPSAGEEKSPKALLHFQGRANYMVLLPDKDKLTGKFPLVATSTRSLGTSGANDSRLVISGDTDVFTDRVIEAYPANLDLARGLVQWGLRREGLVAVSDRTMEDPYVTPTEYQKRFAFFWPMAVIFLPLIFGGMVWWARRR